MNAPIGNLAALGFVVGPAEPETAQSPQGLSQNSGQGNGEGKAPIGACAANAQAQATLQDQQAVSNATFLQGIFGNIPEGHGIAVAHFRDYGKPNWKAEYWTATGCPDHPKENTYFCPSSLCAESRTLESFAALHVVVIDDVKPDAQLPEPTYAIETSEGNYQLGYKLTVPLTDKTLAKAIHNLLHQAKYCDANGNNPVRWIRLPVGTNTKPERNMFAHRLTHWNPGLTFQPEQLIELLRLQGQPTQAQPAQPTQAQLDQTIILPATNSAATEFVDAKTVTELRSALNAIPADNYDTWQRMGLALKPLGNIGRELWLTWSQTCLEKYNAAAAEHKWANAFNDTRSSYQAVFAEAQKRGWVNPNSNAAQVGGAAPFAGMGWAPPGFQKASPDYEKGADLLSKLRKKSATYVLEELKMKAETEVLAFGEVGSLGQFISLHALPGKGKTLITMYWVLQAIEKGIIKGENVFYLNFDDNANGFIDKTEIAAELGFNMLGPNQTSVGEVSEIIAGLCDNDSASGTVFIFDTLKKFVDVMHKAQQTEFYKLMRRYVMSGGTVVTLGHVNKNRDSNEKLIVAGTQDIADDVDALYVIDVVEGTDLTVVEVEKRKNRGIGVEVAYYSFGSVNHLEGEDATGKHVNRYKALLQTVMPLADSNSNISKGMMDRQLSMQKYQHVIEAIRVAISAGIGQQMQIVEAVNTGHGIGKNLIRKVLSAHTWTSTDNYIPGVGFLWFCSTGPNNSKNYTLTQG